MIPVASSTGIMAKKGTMKTRIVKGLEGEPWIDTRVFQGVEVSLKIDEAIADFDLAYLGYTEALEASQDSGRRARAERKVSQVVRDLVAEGKTVEEIWGATRYLTDPPTPQFAKLIADTYKQKLHQAQANLIEAFGTFYTDDVAEALQAKSLLAHDQAEWIADQALEVMNR